MLAPGCDEEGRIATPPQQGPRIWQKKFQRQFGHNTIELTILELHIARPQTFAEQEVCALNQEKVREPVKRPHVWKSSKRQSLSPHLTDLSCKVGAVARVPNSWRGGRMAAQEGVPTDVNHEQQGRAHLGHHGQGVLSRATSAGVPIL